MPNYQNAKIYKLWSPEGDDIYIGSTTQKLYARKAQHKKYKDCSAKILYEKYNDVRIELLECCPCDNKEELTKKEGEYIRNNNCINQINSGINARDNKKEYDKEWRNKHKEKITCECGKEVYKLELTRHRRGKKHQDAIGGASTGALFTSATA